MATRAYSRDLDLAEELRSILGPTAVLTNEADRTFYSSDVYRRGDVADIVVRPGGVEELRACVACATAAGYALVPRGGGLSYTGGILPTRTNSVVLDLGRLNQVVEVNVEDSYVTVECGASWRELYDTLKARGLRTPYFGPMSGFSSTIGGALSQGSVFLGSTQFGVTAETVLGLEVVLADGTIVKLGSAATPHEPTPFFRDYGPDLAGPFLGDAGALGVKARATLKLMPFPEHQRFASFSFTTYDEQLRVMAEIGRRGIAAECFGTDPVISNMRIHESNLSDQLKYVAGVALSARNVARGAVDATLMALRGKSNLGAGDYVVNVAIDARYAQTADAMLSEVRSIGRSSGRELDPTIPQAVRGTPFVYPNSVLGAQGERWAPIHGVVPYSRAIEAMRAFDALFARHRETMAEHEIVTGFVTFAIGRRAMLIECMMYWPGRRDVYHERVIEPAHLRSLKISPDSPAAAAVVSSLRNEITEMLMRLGAAHLQIGKTYRYREGRNPDTFAILEALKRHVDPKGLMNPGALGLA